MGSLSTAWKYLGVNVEFDKKSGTFAIRFGHLDELSKWDQKLNALKRAEELAEEKESLGVILLRNPDWSSFTESEKTEWLIKQSQLEVGSRPTVFVSPESEMVGVGEKMELKEDEPIVVFK